MISEMKAPLRRSYGRIPNLVELKDLIATQIDSFNWFTTEGLRELFDVSVAHVTLLAPVVVVVAAVVAGLGVFWFRAAADSIRESRRPRLVVAAIAAILALGIVLTVLGVELPRE